MNAETRAELLAIAKRINKADPAKADIKAYQALLDANPDAWRMFGDMALNASNQILKTIGANTLVRETIESGVIEQRKTLGWAESSPIERLLIEQAVLCWVNHNLLEFQCASIMHEQNTLTLRAHYDQLLTNSQLRYLRAIESLARIRRLLKMSGVQINVALAGGQQVNQVVQEG